jgi:pentose-5-phosphate-3-epimerase
MSQLDLICVMAVEPGFAEQKFIDATLPKLDQVADLIRAPGAPAGDASP